MSGMFGKNKRPLSDLLNPARRKGGTKGPPARRTKSFIHSLCICPCLSRAAFLVGWCGAGAPGSFSARSPCERGRGWCPPAGSDKGCASQLRSVALGSPEGRLCPDPGAPQPGAHSGEPERWKGATAPALCAASRGNAPVRFPAPGCSCGRCVVASQMFCLKVLFVFGVFRCLVSLLPV